MPRLLHHISARYLPTPLEPLVFLQDAAHGACLSPKIQYAGTLGC